MAASFLQRFVKKGTKWMHIDMAGVMHNIPVPYVARPVAFFAFVRLLMVFPASYLREGMTGIPVRTLVEYLRNEGKVEGKLLGPYEP